MLHYNARHFFAPILISPYINGGDVIVYLVVDEMPSFDVNNPLDVKLNLKPHLSEDERPFSLFSLRYGFIVV